MTSLACVYPSAQPSLTLTLRSYDPSSQLKTRQSPEAAPAPIRTRLTPHLFQIPPPTTPVPTGGTSSHPPLLFPHPSLAGIAPLPNRERGGAPTSL